MDESETWTEADDVQLAFESLPAWHPTIFVDAVRIGLQRFDGHALQILQQGFLTPESTEAWGDFSAAQEIANSRLRLSMHALWAVDAPDVAYVRWVETEASIAPDLRRQRATLHATIVWRPEIAVTPGSAWRLHALGHPIHPDLVPRTAIGFDPRKLPA